jgi:UPF0755 protein
MNPIETQLKQCKEWCTAERVHLTIFLALLLFVGYWIWATSAPRSLAVPVTIEISKGDSVKQITQTLEDARVIRSRAIANALIILGAGDTRVVSGVYLFETHPNVFEVVRRITRGDFGVDTKTIFIPEGFTVEQIGDLFAKQFTYFDKEAFYQLTEGKEGYLFPDTYTFLETVKAYEVVEVLERTFTKKTDELMPLIKASGRTFDDVIVMASIVEKEASATSRQEVADILWKRLDMDMPLQVDATFVYSVGKGTFDLTHSDLRDASNAYNTYTHKGLPPTAISNPGLEAIKAAATKQETDYLFFLTGRDGAMYYAKTFEKHVENKRKFLR